MITENLVKMHIVGWGQRLHISNKLQMMPVMMGLVPQIEYHIFGNCEDKLLG